MLPEIDRQFEKIKRNYGKSSIERIEAMMLDHPSAREPFQKDAKWIVPGLSTTGWLETRDFPQLEDIVKSLEDNSEQIRVEFSNARNNRESALSPYRHYLQTQENWKALYLFKDGSVVTDHNEVPTAKRILNEQLKDWICPLLEMHFSMLEPGAEIAPHCDLWNFSINLHLAVEIPEDCGIKVSNETRTWQQGKCLLFDYSYLHQAWNHSNKDRVCLLMDIWHPDLTLAEREALVVFISEIRKYF